ncbi:hypothetical protein J416_03076 [Gracilibacillus halophilus YIM-C55.5]|uniref:M23ase beta-sheet core domain-containing protein n=1 Tax=Gracilibacillus halophilus YIM-C55.5 TaxID=1308866 RepID=N4WP44_9BACI|nr:M23 family metallopeptidase [Gracilibacillus halophilus]ENH97902.1 hypothetical protein J416_03076 [Gracilibacillus halophilus YIM-C55.5]
MAEFKGYRITSPYGNRTHPISGGADFHSGVDLVKSHQAPIHSFTSGTVLYAGFGQSGTGFGGYGNVVFIKDRNNRGLLYAHLDRIAVSNHQRVSEGEVIGYQGATGYVTGSHLHFEVRKQAESSPPYGYRSNESASTMDPIEYIQQRTSSSQLIESGDRGSDVEDIQQKLLRLGYALPTYGLMVYLGMKQSER